MSTSLTSIAGVILAGGKSSRMGVNKALIPYNGKRLIDHMADTLKDAKIPVYISGVIPPFNNIPDLISYMGPIGGIISAVNFLHGLQIQAAIFIPVDMPGITVEVIIKLTNLLNKQDAIHYRNNPLPLLLKFSPKVIGVINNFKDNLPKDRSIKNLLNKLHTTECNSDGIENNVFTNVNTPEDWQQFIKSLDLV